MNTQEIIRVELSTNAEDDAPVAAQIVKGKASRLKSFRGDEAYDDFKFREALGKKWYRFVPLPKDAVICKGTAKKPLAGYLKQRNEAVGMIGEKVQRVGRRTTGITSGV